MVSRTRVAYVQGAASSKKRGNQQVHEDVLAACTLQFSNTESLTGLSISLRWIPARGTGKQLGPFGRASALPKTAPALAPQMERLFWWSWSRFRKCLAKQLHLLD